MTDMPATPELDKQSALNQPRPPFEVLSDFYDWLEVQGLYIAHYGRRRQRTQNCPKCNGTGFDVDSFSDRQRQLLKIGALVDADRARCTHEGCFQGKVWVEYVDDESMEPHPWGENPTELFAQFWGIDLVKIDREREALLAALRQTAPPRCRSCNERVEREDWLGSCGKNECVDTLTKRREADVPF